MAKRFTDTEKWRDEWWGSLGNDYRMIWLYLVDSCSIAGVWKKDFRGLNFNCNTNITEDEFKKIFGSRIIDKGHFFFIPKFLRFQCPKGLNSNKPAILSIVKELQLNNLTETVNQLFGNDYLIIKDKDKGKDKNKGKEKGKDKDKYITVENEKVFDVIKILEYYEAPLNGRQKEQQLRNWRDVALEWFDQNLQLDFNDNKHVLNAFSQYFMKHGRPPNGKGNGVHKLTDEELRSI